MSCQQFLIISMIFAEIFNILCPKKLQGSLKFRYDVFELFCSFLQVTVTFDGFQH